MGTGVCVGRRLYAVSYLLRKKREGRSPAGHTSLCLPLASKCYSPCQRSCCSCWGEARCWPGGWFRDAPKVSLLPPPPAPAWAGPDRTLTSSGSVSLFPRMALNAYPQTTCPGWPWGAEARGGVPHLADTGCGRWCPSRRSFPWWGLGWLPCDVPLLFKALP